MVTSRIWFTAAQKAELWERWKNGQSAAAISRALERRNKTGIERIVVLHGGIDAAEKVVVRKQLRRSQVLAFFKALPPCLIGMEACATAHYWARELTKLGHQVRLMPPKDVKAYLCQAQQERCRRRRGDLRGGAAADHAVLQIKSVEQQGRLMLHRARDLLMRQRTQVINALRAHLAELGIMAAQGREGIKELLKIIASEEDAGLPVDAIHAEPRSVLGGATSLERGEPAAGEHPRHWGHRGHRDGRDRSGSQGLSIGS